MTTVLVQPVRRRIRIVHPAFVAVAGVLALSACSSVPDAVNPVEWYRGVSDWISSDDEDDSGLIAATPPAEQRAPGSDQPFPSLATTPERPTPTPPAQRQQIADSLAADRDRARYTEEVLRRGPASASRSQVAAAPPPDAAPDAAAPPAAAAPPRPARPPARSETALSGAPVPVPPPAPLGTTPPAPAGLERVTPPPAPPEPPAVTRSLTLPPAPPAPPQFADVRTVYEQRLAESAPSTSMAPAAPPPMPAPMEAPQLAAAPVPAPADAPSALSVMETPDRPSVSVQVADIFFSHGSASLDGRDRGVLREVIALQKARGGRIRVVGHASHRTGTMDLATHKLANFSISVARANAVARELVQLGADRNVVLASARADQEPVYREVMPNGEAGNRRAEVYLEY